MIEARTRQKKLGGADAKKLKSTITLNNSSRVNYGQSSFIKLTIHLGNQSNNHEMRVRKQPAVLSLFMNAQCFSSISLNT